VPYEEEEIYLSVTITGIPLAAAYSTTLKE
jgi:hypothetical protein